MSVAVPLFTYAASVNHKGDHTIKETTLGNQATEAPYNATAIPFSEADLVRVGELRCDKMRTREGGSAVPGRVKTQRLTVTNGSWDGSGHTTNALTFNGTADGEGNAALYVQGGGADVVGGLRVNGDTTIAGAATITGYLKHPKPAFCVGLSTTFVTPAAKGVIKPWGWSWINTGGFNLTEGTFTAPVSGVYKFTLSATSAAAGGLSVTLRRNGSEGVDGAKPWGYTNEAGDYRNLAFTFMCNIAKDQYIDLYSWGGNYLGGGFDITSSGFTVFTGELMYTT